MPIYARYLPPQNRKEINFPFISETIFNNNCNPCNYPLLKPRPIQDLFHSAHLLSFPYQFFHFPLFYDGFRIILQIQFQLFIPVIPSLAFIKVCSAFIQPHFHWLFVIISSICTSISISYNYFIFFNYFIILLSVFYDNQISFFSPVARETRWSRIKFVVELLIYNIKFLLITT